MKNFNIIPIVFITDYNFSIPTAVAISSLIANKKKETFYKISIISADLNKDIEDKLYSFSENENITVNIVRVNEDKYQMFHRKGHHVSSTALYKFEIPNLLPEYDKIIYLDGDILVKNDLSELYNLELNNYYVGAVRDMTAEVSYKIHAKIPVDEYLNAGVMILNLKKIREDNLTDRAIETLYERGHDYVCGDQDVFNFVFKENVLWLNPEYNAMIYNLVLENYTIERINQFYDTNYISIEQLIKNASIIHLTNRKKPWHNKFTFMNKEWFEYFRKSPFKDLTELDNFETQTWEAEIQCQRREQELVLKNKELNDLSNRILDLKDNIVEKEILLHSIYVSRSWRITAPLRWLGTQITLLRQHGFTGRLKAVIKKIVRFLIIFLDSRQKLRLYCVVLLRRTGTYNYLRSFYYRHFNQQHLPNQPLTVDKLTPRARQIYNDLKAAIQKNKKDNL